jgi:glycerol-3-phosphate cytidylyltransferase
VSTVLTYGTFDLFHYGHISLLLRARALGTKLCVGLSTEDFNDLKGKTSYMGYDERREILLACRCVDDVFPEETWEQKSRDIVRLGASVLVMGDDWEGKFDHFSNLCRVEYLPRTPIISSTLLRENLVQFKAA